MKNWEILDLPITHWGEVKNHNYDMAILPWGAMEPHNKHLPYLTDSILSYEIAKDSAQKAYEETKVLAMVLPPLYLGAQNPGQWDLPFCVHFNLETQKAVLSDIIASLHVQGLRKLVILNGHGGNSFKPIIRDLAMKYPDFTIILCDWWTFIPRTGYFEETIDEHAGEQETSVMMYYHPEWVNLDIAGDGTPKSSTLESLNNKTGWKPRNWQETTTDTGIGNPKKSTAEKGERYVKNVIDRIAKLLTELKEA
ncbi:MAG: creatininase family protein [Paludibacteraceae bacterium]